MNEYEEKLASRFEIVRLWREGFSQRQIAEKTSVPRSTVKNILQKYNKHNTILRVKGSGRRKSLSEDDRAVLVEIAKNCPRKSARKISLEVAETSGKAVSDRTVQRELKNVSFVSATPRKLPLLSKKNILDRLGKATTWSSWTLRR